MLSLCASRMRPVSRPMSEFTIEDLGDGKFAVSGDMNFDPTVFIVIGVVLVVVIAVLAWYFEKKRTAALQ